MSDISLPIHTPQKSWYKHANKAITILILCINSYVIILPMLPYVELWYKKQNAPPSGIAYQTSLPEAAADNGRRAPVPADYRLVIPSLALDQLILTGDDPHLVNRGVWQRPISTTPDKKSNTVLVGHRFTYDGESVFYHLDKVRVGEKIIVYHNSTEYIYEVIKTYVVPPTAVEIEAPTSEARLTIYTCTPLWSAKDRLVIESRLLSETKP